MTRAGRIFSTWPAERFCRRRLGFCKQLFTRAHAARAGTESMQPSVTVLFRQARMQPRHCIGLAKKSPKHLVAPVGAGANRDKAHEIASRCRRRTPARWCRRRALASFHGVVQGVAVGNIDERAATAERWQGGDSPPLSLRAEKQAQ